MFLNSLQETFDKFEAFTRFPLNQYLNDCAAFFKTQSKDIINYYSGLQKEPNIKSFNLLADLQRRSIVLQTTIISNQNWFATTDYWDLLELTEDIRVKLSTIENSSKWLRSSITKNTFNPNPEIDYIMSQNQTLERVSDNVVNDSTPDDDWVRIALRNDLSEIDYSMSGGTQLKLSLQASTSTLRLQTVVDNIQGERVYGIDLDRKITFINNDLKALSPRATIKQAVEILGQLRKGDVPEFPGDGLQASLVVGSNMGSVVFPSIMRQLYETFQKDDTLKSFTVTNIKQEQDSVFIEFSVDTRLDETLPLQSITL